MHCGAERLARGTLSALIALSIAVGPTDGRRLRRRLFALSAADLSRAPTAAKSGARSSSAGRVTRRASAVTDPERGGGQGRGTGRTAGGGLLVAGMCGRLGDSVHADQEGRRQAQFLE